jgi:hypothetical protein
MPDTNASNGLAVRRALIIESLLNFGSFPLITHTRQILGLLLLHPSYITPGTLFFARALGLAVVGILTPLLLAGVPSTRSGIESRRTIYTALGLGEIMLIPYLVMEAMKGGKEDAAISVKVAVGAIMALAPPLAWRGYTMYMRPEMMGGYEGKRD